MTMTNAIIGRDVQLNIEIKNAVQLCTVIAMQAKAARSSQMFDIKTQVIYSLGTSYLPQRCIKPLTPLCCCIYAIVNKFVPIKRMDSGSTNSLGIEYSRESSSSFDEIVKKSWPLEGR